jgi:hypothetical protein
MTGTKYIGMDVHKESNSSAVRNGFGKRVMECVIETKASMILQFLQGLRGELYVTFEEGTWAAWLLDLLKPHVTKVVVCDPRRNALLQEGNKNDRIDTRKLAELLYLDKLHPGESDLSQLEYSLHGQAGLWLASQIPSLGPIRAAVLLGIVQTPHRFRTKRPLWKYSGFAIETHSSADHRSVHGQLQRAKKQISVRGLNQNCNHDLKNLFKGAAIIASSKPGPFQEFYTALLAKGMRPEMARPTLARIATMAWIVGKKGVCFDARYLKPQTA